MRRVSVSLIVHPRNPYVPTSHANFRFFLAAASDAVPTSGAEDIWWFGGGFDLTPVYGFSEDAVHWHRTAKNACVPFGEDLYPNLKKACDEYFYLKHRHEHRGIGGLFFDDFDRGGFGSAFDFCSQCERGLSQGLFADRAAAGETPTTQSSSASFNFIVAVAMSSSTSSTIGEPVLVWRPVGVRSRFSPHCLRQSPGATTGNRSRGVPRPDCREIFCSPRTGWKNEGLHATSLK